MEIQPRAIPVEAIIQPRNSTELRTILAAASIDLSGWGAGTHKSVNDLLAEIEEGETVMWHDTDARLRRNVRVVWADVWCQMKSGQLYRLEETMQV